MRSIIPADIYDSWFGYRMGESLRHGVPALLSQERSDDFARSAWGQPPGDFISYMHASCCRMKPSQRSAHAAWSECAFGHFYSPHPVHTLRNNTSYGISLKCPCPIVRMILQGQRRGGWPEAHMTESPRKRTKNTYNSLQQRSTPGRQLLTAGQVANNSLLFTNKSHL